FFEWGASRSSAAIARIISSARPGLYESDIMSAMTYRGEPFSYHPILTSGPDIPNGIRSPTNRIVKLGDAIFATVGMWGGNCGRGGILGTCEDDCHPENAGFLKQVAIPYWRTVVAWWETVHVGLNGGDVHERLTEACRTQGFSPTLGTGHLIDWEDWPNTPIRQGSNDVIKSGMLFASDIFSDANGPQMIAHCEDTVAVADTELRAELAERHPEVWVRINTRRRFMREQLGINVLDDLLPFSIAPAYFCPFWLAPDMALRMRKP
ncbi:MAG: M24 family metallopeptidase, partial [Spirochaetota bacterium]